MPLNITYFDKVKYSSQDFNDRFSDFFGSGILKSTDLPVTYPPTANMTLNIGIGTALINGYRINNDSVTTLTLNPSDSANSRIDIVQIGYSATTDSSGLTTGDAVLEIKQGVAAATPVEPGADTNFIKLYAINVPSNATSITSSNVTDKRSLVPLNIDGSQITFNGAQKTIAQGITAPLSPDDKDLWIDTSVTPNVLKRYDVTTTSWVKVTPTQASEVGSPPTTRKVSTGTGLTGGGDLSADRTISLDTTYLGTTSKVGLLQLVDSIASTDATKAATANSVKMALDWVTSFGLGGNAKTGMTDANTITGSGFYEFVGSEANLPTTNGGVIIHVDRDTRPIQLAINYQYNIVYSRSYTGSSGWTAWSTLNKSDRQNIIDLANASAHLLLTRRDSSGNITGQSTIGTDTTGKLVTFPQNNTNGPMYQIPDMSDFANSKSTNGYQKLPNGMILQWGEYTNTDTTPINGITCNFPIAFPNAVYSVTATPEDSSLGQTAAYSWITGLNTSNFFFRTNVGCKIKYFAIGY